MTINTTKARYARTSTTGQSMERQSQRQSPDEKLYIDQVSGSKKFAERPAGKQLLADIDAGLIQSVAVSSIDRLGRSAFDIQETLHYLNQKSINVKVDNLGIESLIDGKPNSIFKLITDVLSNVAAMQLENSKEAQKEGIKAKQNRVKANVDQWNGRGESKEKLDDAKLIARYKTVAKHLNEGRLSLREINAKCGVSLATVQRVKASLARIAAQEAI